MTIRMKVQPWPGHRATRRDGKPIAYRQFSSEGEIIEELANAIMTRLRTSGYWCWVSGSCTRSRYLDAMTLDQDANVRKFKIRIGDHSTVNTDLNLLIYIQGEHSFAWEGADLKLETRTEAWRVLPEGEVEYLKLRTAAQGKSIYVNTEEICTELLAEEDRWAETVNRAVAAAKEALGLRKISPVPFDDLLKQYALGQRVDGSIVAAADCGFIIDLGGVFAFLPGSQVDVRPVREVDVDSLMGLKQPFQILKMDHRRGNIVVSRRAILEESRAEQRAEVISSLSEGQTVEGVVKTITDCGAFVDLGGVEGLLHVTDLAWRRVSHPSEILTIGETTKVQVIKINKEPRRISLGMKQLQDDPWDLVAAKYPLASVHQGRVTNITDYGAFVELEAGVEGLVHVSEMSWTKKNVHPGKIVSRGEEVDVMVLEIDGAKRRVSLGLKQTQRNPWEVFAETHPEGTEVEGEVKNITEFGLFIGLEGDIDGMVHLSDLSWDERGEEAIQNYRKGDVVQAVVSEVDVEKERISLSIKALGGGKAE